MIIMKRIKLLFAAILLLALASCRKEVIDPYENFKLDVTPRWENGVKVEKNDESTFVFVTDMGGALFSSAKYKTGRMAADGSDYEFIEFSGSPAIGNPLEPSIRRLSETIVPYKLEIMKIESGKLWIVFQETKESSERRIVQ